MRWVLPGHLVDDKLVQMIPQPIGLEEFVSIAALDVYEEVRCFPNVGLVAVAL